jgi:hypothetical protein
MQRLREQQRRLAALILEPDRPASDDELLGLVGFSDAALARERLAAYVNGYPARIFEALDESFPAVRHLAGDAAFGEVVQRYSSRVPRGIYSLSDVGAELPAFLASDPIGERLPFLADLAALEWRIALAFHAHERAPLDPSSLAGWGLEHWERATIELQSSVAVVRSIWPILDLWNLRETPISEIDLELAGRAQTVLVSRDGFSVSCDLLDCAQAVVLEALLDGATLGVALERLATPSEEDADESTASAGSTASAVSTAPAVSKWFAGWAARGLIVHCRAAPAS